MMPFQAIRLRKPPVNTSNYAALVLASSPWLYWRLGETSTSTAADASGNSRVGNYKRDASNTTTAGLLTGDANSAYLGPAVTSAPVSGVFRSSSIDPAVNFTATIIIRPDGVPPSSGFGGLLQLGANGSGCPELGITDQGGGFFKIRVGRSGVATLFSSTSSWAYGTRLHVKLSRNTGNVIALRVNGAAEGSTTFNFATVSTATNIGFNNTGATDGFQFYGALDEFAVWSSFIADATTDAQYAAM